MKKTAAIIQARMGSTRLPGKVLKKIKDKTVLAHVIERVRQSSEIDEIIIATTNLARDNKIVKEAQNCNVNYYRGSEDDVLCRYYHAAKENDVSLVVRITSDCPLIDPFVVDDIVSFFKENDYDLVTNAGSDLTQRTYPRGLDTEVFPLSKLEEAFNNAEAKYQREHVTPYIYETSKNIYYYTNNIDYSDYRLTLDENADWELIFQVYDKLYNGDHVFYLEDIIKIIDDHHLKNINAHVEQRNIEVE
ncbi:MAG: cytidylyltransferase domain-containing protein [Halanaerobiales bacterium]